VVRYASLALILITATASQGPHASELGHGRVEERMDSKISMRVGDKTFAATLVETPTTAAFKRLLPLSVTMTELNGNEKLFRLPSELPIKSSRPGSIEIGDLMLYGSDTIVVFYKSFPTPYSYTRLGRIDDVRGLEAALGAGSADVTFQAP